MGPLDSQIVTISPEQLDELFREVPSTTPNAGALPGGTEPSTQTTNKTGGLDIPFVDVNNLPGGPTEPTVPANATTTVSEPVVTTQEPTTTEPPEPTEPAVQSTPDDVKQVLKNTVEHLINSGLWEDFDGRQDLEFDEDTYAKLSAAQVQNKVEGMFAELVDNTGIYGKAILTHLRNGGNPDDVIDLFKEQKQVESIDTTTDEGKIELIHRYYSDIVGWKPDRIKKHIQTLTTNPDDMKEEVTEINEKYDEYYQEQLGQIEQQNQARQAAEVQRQRAFSQNINKAITEREDLPAKDKKFLERAILDFRHELPDGRRVNDFFVQFAKIQQDPQAYLDLVQFVMDKESYDIRIKSRAETKAATNAFRFVTGGAASNKKGTTATPDTTAPAKPKTPGTDFSSLLKRK